MEQLVHPTRTALVLGATGGIGGLIVQALLRHGWQVRGMARDAAAAAKELESLEWIEGDAMNREQVIAAADGVSAIIHAVNPPHYQNWDRLVLPMIDNTIAAARASGARILLPGTVYNFDPRKTPLVSADTPQRPTSRKGRIRVELERRMAHAAPDVRSVVLRAGDFFGPGVRSSWFSQAMVKPGQPLTAVTRVTKGPGHSWAYLPDLAEAAALVLGAEDRLSAFESLQFEGLYDETGLLMVHLLEQAAGQPLHVKAFPWWLMHLAAPFGGFPREAAEIAQFWRHPLRFDNRRLIEIIGAEPRTDFIVALRNTLTALGCTSANAEPLAEDLHSALHP
jgi:nucleoside-diphosphate-sugar epimerase